MSEPQKNLEDEERDDSESGRDEPDYSDLKCSQPQPNVSRYGGPHPQGSPIKMSTSGQAMTEKNVSFKPCSPQRKLTSTFILNRLKKFEEEIDDQIMQKSISDDTIVMEKSSSQSNNNEKFKQSNQNKNNDACNRDSEIVNKHGENEVEKFGEDLLKRKHDKLKELIQTEENYLNDLLKISAFFLEIKKSMDDPNYPIKMPESLQKSERILFENFYEICDFHKEIFTDGLKASEENAEGMRDIFRLRKQKLKDIYGKYCNNWRKCENILESFKKSYFAPMKCHLNSDFWLQDEMIKPIQMLNRYHLFFGDLLKICEQIGEEDNAILYDECYNISKEICQNANDVMATGNIRNFPDSHTSINELGVLIKRGCVHCRLPRKVATFGSSIFNMILKNNTRNASCHLFLFKKCLIVCSYKKTGKEFELQNKYSYVATFWINRMKIQENRNNQFILCDNETGLNMSFESISLVEDINEWGSIISREIERNHCRIRRERKLCKLMIRTKSISTGDLDIL